MRSLAQNLRQDRACWRPWRSFSARLSAGTSEAENIAITSGAQTAYFMLFNLLAGRMPDGSRRKIMLPLVPEYIGYSDQGIDGPVFHAVPPLIEKTGPHEFKYRVDFERLEITPDVAALCVSRPTNPSGNVLTEGEIARLSDLAERHGIPLIIDNAYGASFPGGYFFYGLDDPDWKHREECIRVSYAMDGAVVREGLRVIADEVRSEPARTRPARG